MNELPQLTDSTELPLRGRLLFEVRQSPVKAIALGALFLVAVFVWGPKFFAGAAKPPAPVASSGALESAPGGAPSIAQTPPGITDSPAADALTSSSPAAFAMRDPSDIRKEFISISAEAHDLRRAAEVKRMGRIERDPFQPLPRHDVPVVITASAPAVTAAVPADATERAEFALLKLTGVMVFKIGRTAVIDGRLMRQGDTIGSFEVTRVDARRVELKGRHGAYVLTMDPKPDASAPAKKENEP